MRVPKFTVAMLLLNVVLEGSALFMTYQDPLREEFKALHQGNVNTIHVWMTAVLGLTVGCVGALAAALTNGAPESAAPALLGMCGYHASIAFLMRDRDAVPATVHTVFGVLSFLAVLAAHRARFASSSSSSAKTKST